MDNEIINDDQNWNKSVSQTMNKFNVQKQFIKNKKIIIINPKTIKDLKN